MLKRRVAVVDLTRMGLGLIAFIEIEAADHSEAWRGTFLGAVADMPQIMEIDRMAGDVDYLLRVAITDMAAFPTTCTSASTSRAPMKSVTSRFSMETLRASTVYPLLDEPRVDRP